MSSNKRGNIFGQGKPERPYEERDSDPADVPQRATAAQLATRKIKSAKARRPAGAPSGLSQSANFGAPQTSGFNFGASTADSTQSGASLSTFGGSTVFGGAATNSFPPAQSAAPSNTFTNSSFPAFGASNQSTGFNPQPPSSTGFNFTSGGSNPFAASSSAPPTNGNTPAPAFGGSNLFNAQSQSNPFGGLSQTTTSSAAPITNMFGTSNSAAPTNMFGTTSAAANTASTPAPAAPTFSFGAPSTSAQSSASTPATTSMFGGFGAATQTAAPVQNSMFGGFGTGPQKSEAAAEASAPQKNLFASIGAGTKSTEESTAATPAPSLFSFGATTQKNDSGTATAPSISLFGASNTSTAVAASASTPAPANNPFSKLAATTSNPTPSLFGESSTLQAQEKTPASTNLFSGLHRPESSTSASANTPKANPFASLPKPTQQDNSAAADTPKPNLFASLAKPNSTPAAAPSASTPSFSLFGAQDKDKSDEGTGKLKLDRQPNVPGAIGQGVYNAFSTPQPVKTTEADKVNAGAFTTQPKSSSGIFSQTFQSEKAQTSIFKPMAGLPAQTPTEGPRDAAASTNPFVGFPAATGTSSNLFAPKVPASTSSMQNASEPSSTAPSTSPELPKIPKVHIPKEWAVPDAPSTQPSGNVNQQILNWTAQLQTLNVRYRQQIVMLPPTADWSAVSLWHHQNATDIKKKIDTAKKQRAGAKGIFGNESTVMKRKINDENPEQQDASPSKRARPAAPAMSTTQPSAPTPKINPPLASSTNMFAQTSNSNLSKSTTAPASTSLFAPKTGKTSTHDAPKSASSSSGFTPSFSTTNGSSNASTGFKPSFGAGATSGFIPTSTKSTAGNSSFFSQFSKSAKTYEELAAERKAKAKAEDYDSDDETEEEWSRKYDESEARRIEEEKKKVASTPTFSVAGSAKSSGSTTPQSSSFAGFSKVQSGTSTPSGLTPRAASPALSASGSVFDGPSAVQTPSSNIFGHLSSAPSSNNDQEESDDDDSARATARATRSNTSPKRKLGESDGATDGDASHKAQDTATPPKGNLLSRMTRDDDAESEKENNGSTAFGQTNGSTTPANKPFTFFDFGAASSKTASPKTNTFAGDQTFKPGTPIKFGQGSSSEKKDSAPIFSFQPATPSASDLSTTPAKPPPTSIFNFSGAGGGSSLLAPSAGLNGVGSAPSSVFTSRAGTPLSEADTSAASGAEEEEEGSKQTQVDFSQLTEEEAKDHDVVFQVEVTLAKVQGEKDGSKAWVNLAKGPLWILKNKTSGKSLLRVRLPNGANPINYHLLPALKAGATGSSKKMVLASRPAQGGGFQQVLYSFKSADIAEEFITKYNESLPSN
ncbi:hypothetical protein ACN47E_006223 [Coniothyrium glycines]